LQWGISNEPFGVVSLSSISSFIFSFTKPQPGQKPGYLFKVPRKGMAGKESETAEIPVI
jgi:hypothetical protein